MRVPMGRWAEVSECSKLGVEECEHVCGAIAGLMEEVQKKLDKWTEPPPVKQAKPLPRPEEAPRKKRGGRR